MGMSDAKQAKAKAAFAQGVEDENNERASSARLLIDASVRDFYDAARRQRAAQLGPEREAKRVAALKARQEADRKARDRIIAAYSDVVLEGKATPRIKKLLHILNADVGFDHVLNGATGCNKGVDKQSGTC